MDEPLAPPPPEIVGGAADFGPADDPDIYPGEIIVPALEWDDGWGGQPPTWLGNNTAESDFG